MSNIGLTEAEANEIKEERLAPAKKEKKLPVMEIFGPTIQGEGAMIGVRTMFIRFGLCDYKCKMCDSMHAVDPIRVKENARWMTAGEIAHELYEKMDGDKFQKNCEWVTLSGGNPAIHDLTELIAHIRGFDILIGEVKIAIETQGTLFPSWIHMCDVVTVSPKSPGMGEIFEHDKFAKYLVELKHHKGFNVKVVVFAMRDIEFASSINSMMRQEGLHDSMYLSLGNPNPPGLDTELSEDELKLELMKQYSILSEDLLQIPSMTNVKFLPQLHVLAWANKQGV